MTSGKQPSIWGIVLAAGASRRMGRQKLTLPLEDGRPMIRSVLEMAAASRLSRVVVVVSADDEAVQDATNSEDGVWLQVMNPDSAAGMSTSIRTGILAAEAGGADAAVILLGDQPGVTHLHVNAVMDAYCSTQLAIVQASYDGTPSHPILFDRRLFDELLEVTGDEGGRKVVKRHQSERHLVSIEGDVPVDLDTPESYAAWLKHGGSSQT